MPFDIESYVLDNLSNVKRSTGAELNATCPFCDKPDRFYINGESGRWVCFKCDQRGTSVAGIIAQVEGITFERARAMMMRASVQFKRKETPQTLLQKIKALRGSDEEEVEAQVDFALPDEFRPVWKDGKWAMPMYLKERGVKKQTAKAWGMGFCSAGRFGGRIIIPVSCPNGKSFTARDATGEQQPRYLNPKGADHRRLFCGWNMMKSAPKGQVTLVEGPLDAVMMWQHGLPALSMMGKVLHFEQFAMLCETYKPDTEIVVMTDPEEAEAPYKIADRLLVRYERVYIAKLPEGVDPGSSTQEQARKAHDGAERYRGEVGRSLPGLLAKAKERLAKIYQ